MQTLLAVDFANVMRSIGSVLVAIVILLVMITIHEFGHYVAGKILNFKITEFSIGFGPAIFKRRSKKSGEIFALRAVPLGGYCAFDGEDDYEDEQPKEAAKEVENTDEEPFAEWSEDPTQVSEETVDDGGMAENNEAAEEEYPEPKGERFNDQAPWKRIIVLISGALMNYLLGVLLLVIMFSAYGCVHSYVHYRGEGEAAVTSQQVLFDGDIVTKVNGKKIYLAADYGDILVGKKAGDEVTLEVLRKDESGVRKAQTLTVKLLTDCNFKNMNDLTAAYTAFGLDEANYVYANAVMKEGFFETLGYSFVYSFKLAGLVLRSLGELITFKLGTDAIGGPVSTIQTTAQVALEGGLFSTLHIAALIGVNLAVFNLLPIPALDGSKVVFCIIEWIRKKPVNRKVETIIHFVGILFLLAFAILVDILHFIS